MNKAIVICYTGRQIQEAEKIAIENIISGACDATQDLIITTRLDESDIAKALLKKSAEDSKISFTEDATESRIIEEARTKAIQLIKSKYSGATGHISLTRDIVMARYHHHENAMDDDERTLLDAIEVIMDIPQKRLNTLLPKATREVIFTTRDL
jgi:hypothetical protein